MQLLLQGIGSASTSFRSNKILKWKEEEGHMGYFQPFINGNIPVNLRARDVLHDVGAVLTTQPAQRMMRSMGRSLGRGLGNSLQGKAYSTTEEEQITRHAWTGAAWEIYLKGHC